MTSDSRVKESNPKDAIGTLKPGRSNVPRTVLAELDVAMLEGAVKYGRHNYREIGVRASIYVDAADRHIDKFWEGQDIDPDSGLHHITKAIASLTVLRDAIIQDKCIDDRPPKTDELDAFYAGLEQKVKDVAAKYPKPKFPYTESDIYGLIKP